MAVQDIRYYLNGILFVAEGKQLSLVATDGHRLAFCQRHAGIRRAHQTGSDPAAQDGAGAAAPAVRCRGTGAIEMRFAGNQAKFTFGHGFVTKLVEGKFPDYNRVIPAQPPQQHHAGPRPAAGQPAAHRHHDQRQVQGVRLNSTWQPARGLNNAEQEEAVGRTRHRLRRRPIEIGFNVTYLLDVLANMGRRMVKHGAGRRQQLGAVWRSRHPHFKYVVMPMRI